MALANDNATIEKFNRYFDQWWESFTLYGVETFASRTQPRTKHTFTMHRCCVRLFHSSFVRHEFLWTYWTPHSNFGLNPSSHWYARYNTKYESIIIRRAHRTQHCLHIVGAGSIYYMVLYADSVCCFNACKSTCGECWIALARVLCSIYLCGSACVCVCECAVRCASPFHMFARLNLRLIEDK